MSRLAIVKRAIGAVAVGALAAICAVSRAASIPTDYTDTWWNPAESGWGVQLIQQVDVIFATIYVYDLQSDPDWYAATLKLDPSGTWKGDLYATHGPWFGGPFNPTVVTTRRVGDLALTFSGSNRGALVYSIDGVPVTKTVERMTMQLADLSGTYMFWMNATVGACGDEPAQSGALGAVAQFIHTPGQISAEVQIVAADGVLSCNFSGNYVQAGRLGRTEGPFSCPAGGYGTYSMTDLETAPDHMCGELLMRNSANGCTLTSTFASIRQ